LEAKEKLEKGSFYHDKVQNFVKATPRKFQEPTFLNSPARVFSKIICKPPWFG